MLASTRLLGEYLHTSWGMARLAASYFLRVCACVFLLVTTKKRTGASSVQGRWLGIVPSYFSEALRVAVSF